MKCLTQILERVKKVEGWETDIIMNQLRRNGVTIINGTAKFEDEHHVCVEPCPDQHGLFDDEQFDYARVRFKNALISVGTYPARPEMLTFDDKYIFDSDTILSRKKKSLPKNIIVIGSGVIALE